MSRVGVLALQGNFAAHARVLTAIGRRPVEIRAARDLEGLEGLILPGGESTVMLKLLAKEELETPLLALARRVPVLATCAGMILLAREVLDPAQRSFGLLDLTVRRNGWGRQVESFEATSDDRAHHLIFIRAPRIERVGREVEVLARFEKEPVFVRQGSIWAATFHPELTADTSIHRLVFGAA